VRREWKWVNRENPSLMVEVHTDVERLSMRRAELAYAPSLNLAEHFDRVHKIKIHVVRPPSYCELKDFSLPPFPLPARFFLHFGQLMERKGTALLARALPIAWKMAPDLTMVWCGRCWDASKLESWRSLWGDRARQVQITGPLAKPQMYAVLQLADAAVLPSQVDNLPNTVIESLMFGIPVLGSRGASIDELIEEGRTGHLVALGDVDGLAETLVKMWLGESPVSKGFEWNSGIANEMRPQRAVANLMCHLVMAKRRTGSHPVLC
jgi:glycogen synthase